MKIVFFLRPLVLMVMFFPCWSYAACYSVAQTTWDITTPQTVPVSGGRDLFQRGPYLGLTQEMHIESLFLCGDGMREYLSKYTGSLPTTPNNFGSNTIYALPDVPGFGVSIDVSDPNQPWVDLKSTPQPLVRYGGRTGLKSRLQYHIYADLKPGSYRVPRTKVGEVWGELVSNRNDKTPIVSLYIPSMTFNVSTYGCVLNVPSNISLSSDLEQSTYFNVTISQCGGDVIGWVRFSDPDALTSTKATLVNKGEAKGYNLKFQTKNGGLITLIPAGTKPQTGEILLGLISRGQTRTETFSALLTRNSEDVRPGTLKFATIVGVSYR
ncbi:hypothetical protein [Aeromonas veronii]|uniref:hypothetical protein n=1 Tax=Aeromonas veronii TaxID=654 RepID=UPI00131532A9|nr:hypothetical protein [Aeromonas veronii]HEA3202495.1 hypothetical protein [Aeromonas veronii]